MGLFRIEKKLEISAAHSLKLPYSSKCENLHGHNWQIRIVCQSKKLNDEGMVIDFTHIKEAVMALDHSNLNDTIPQPTAERIAEFICDALGPICVQVTVQESEGNSACFTR